MTTITLKRPVEHEGHVYTSIKVDEPTAGAMAVAEKLRNAGATETVVLLAMVAKDNDWPSGASEKIRYFDVQAIMDALPPLFEAAPGGAAGDA
ncbi:MAG TPA: hypothetical protein VLA00_16355 [Xanthobacteraceae bacterium]|nr:hypothetical protein [Xanthobacteraceae bacterium]